MTETQVGETITSIDLPKDTNVVPPGPKDPGGPYFGSEVNAKPAPVPMPIEDLIQAQHLFIEACMEMIHHGDVPKFATAQEAYIRAQMKFAGALLDSKSI